MKGMTLDEFEETLVEGWEIDFTVGEMNCHYQRLGEDGVFRLSLSSDLETFFEAETGDIDTVTATYDEEVLVCMDAVARRNDIAPDWLNNDCVLTYNEDDFVSDEDIYYYEADMGGAYDRAVAEGIGRGLRQFDEGEFVTRAQSLALRAERAVTA